MSLADVFVTVRPDVRKFGSDLGRGLHGQESAISRQGERAGRSYHEGFGKSIGKIAGTLAGTFAAITVVDFFKDSIAQAREAAKVTALTNAVLKSTGGVAKISAKDVSDLASALSKKTGIDDEAIQSGENLLLTFTNIRNEVGKGNDIFNQTTALMEDMSVALGQDTKSSAIQLGKALNDPIKGVTALQRVGVSFTKSQRDQIKALVEAGDTMGAQKLILGELKREFGGAAAAAATPAQKAQVAWENLKEEIGTAVLPILDKLATWFVKNLPSIVEHVKEAARNVVTHIQTIQKNWAELRARWEAIFVTIDKTKAWFSNLGDSIGRFWDGVKAAFREGIRTVVSWFLNMVGHLVHGAATAFGWIPGIGPKLRTAAAKFDKFKDDVNRSLSEVHDQAVKVTAAFTANAVAAGSSRRVRWSTEIRGAMGGPVRGGEPGKDSVPYLLMPGEFIVRRDGSNLLDAMQHYATPGMAGGGLIPRVRRPGARDIDRVATSAWKPTAGRIGRRLLEDLIRTMGAGGGGGGYGAGVSRWAGVVLQALAMIGQSPGWLSTVLSRMQRESGGNPYAINLWDVNARRGDPSRGLMQTIGATFNAYANGLRGRGIYDPLANVFAALRYAMARYGSLSALSRPGGYDMGGILQPGRLGLNSTGRPERVLSPDQTALFDRLVTRLEGRASDRAVSVLRLHPDDIRAIGQELRAGMVGANYASGRQAGLMSRTV